MVYLIDTKVFNFRKTTKFLGRGADFEIESASTSLRNEMQATVSLVSFHFSIFRYSSSQSESAKLAFAACFSPPFGLFSLISTKSNS